MRGASRRVVPAFVGLAVALGAAHPAAALSVSWAQLHPGTSPTARYGYGLTYDSGSGHVVLYGGAALTSSGGVNSGETWSWDGSTWSLMQPAVSPPAAREFAMAYDPDLGQTVMFGGVGPSGMTSATWVYNGTTWTQANPAHVPAGWLMASLAYDAADHDLILFGGAGGTQQAPQVGQNATWRWTGSDWQQIATSGSPPGRMGAAMSYDPSIGKLLLFGGYSQIDCSCGNGSPMGDTWEYSGGVWSPVSSTVSPPARFEAAMSYDGDLGETVLYGGAAKQSLADTWTFSGGQWALSTPISPQGCRNEVGSAYDAATKQDVLFGGYANCDLSPYGYMGDTWKVVLSPLGIVVLALAGSLQTFSVAKVQGGRAPYTAVVDWGDGASSSASVVQSGSDYVVRAGHLYTDVGSLAGQVRVRDADGNTASASLPVQVQAPAPASAGGVSAPLAAAAAPQVQSVQPAASPSPAAASPDAPTLGTPRLSAASATASAAHVIRSDGFEVGGGLVLLGLLSGLVETRRLLRRRRRRI